MSFDAIVAHLTTPRFATAVTLPTAVYLNLAVLLPALPPPPFYHRFFPSTTLPTTAYAAVDYDAFNRDTTRTPVVPELRVYLLYCAPQLTPRVGS